MDLFTLLKISMLIAMFFIPLFVFFTANGYLESGVITKIDTTVANPDYRPLLEFRIYMDLFYIPCFMIASLGLSGAFSFFKKYTFNEGALIKRDFFGGIKENLKNSLLVSFFYSAVFYLLRFAVNYLSILDFTYFLVLSIFCWIFIFVLMIQVIFAFAQMPIYTNGFWTIIKTSFFCSCNQIFKGLLTVLCSFFPLILIPYFGIQILTYITMLLYIFLGFSNGVFLSLLYAEDSFDVLVNKKQFPSIYRKGLFQAPSSYLKDDDFLKDLDYE